MSTISGDKFADILDIDNDHEHICGRNNFQVQILVTPLQCEEGGTEITVSGGNLSRGSVEKLPQIHNFQETQWITRRIERVTSNDQLLGARIACNQQKHSPSRNKTNRSPIRKYDVDGCQSGMPSTQEETVARYLRAHPEFLERFVTEEVEPERLEKWIIRRSQRVKQQDAVQRKTSLSKWKFCVHADKRKMLQELTRSLQQNPTRDRVLWELAQCVCSAVDADEFRLYLVERDELVYYKGGTPDGETTVDDDLSEENDVSRQIAERVCRTKEPVRVSQRFQTPKGNVDHILCQPVIQSNGDLTAILELRRREPHEKFHEEDEEIALSYLVWGGIALHYVHLYANMNQQRKLNDFLLAVVKCIFQDMVSMDTLVMKIMNFAQELVDADRASLFLVDTRSQELYATIFDVGKDAHEQVIEGEDAKEIRFPMGTGIAGQVALTGEILNIADAYADSRFNRAVDQITGYKTHTILCMPIFKGKGSIIGVVQMVNKRFGNFTKDDEEAFEMFAVYCGLALHHAKLYDTIKKSEQKYRVALEVLSYHNTCTEEEFQDALRVGVPEEQIGLDDYYFNPFELRDAEKARYAISMFIDLFGLNRFDKNSLLRFTLTVRKNYRRVPYHNWTHGFSVAHCMYAMIKQAKDVFRPNECLALYIGALCHDLDHRGKNNKFMLDTESPLANIYSTSTMEHHHFNQTVTILQQQGHNIFSKLSSVEYKQVLSLLKHCILATDLALFFPNKARLNELVKSDAFSWTNQEHRLLIQAIAMTGSDLSASAKPWEVQVKTVDIIFQEFYDQGDAERAAGRTPIPMMDRNQPEQQPASQVGFLMGICSPCYELLYKLIPQTKGLLDMCEENLTKWKRIDEDIKNGA